MSRSYKKPFVTISKAWESYHEHALRRHVKQVLRQAEVAFDPDADWEEALQGTKGMGEWGTRLGFAIEVGPDDTWYEACQEMKRK